MSDAQLHVLSLAADAAIRRVSWSPLRFEYAGRPLHHRAVQACIARGWLAEQLAWGRETGCFEITAMGRRVLTIFGADLRRAA